MTIKILETTCKYFWATSVENWAAFFWNLITLSPWMVALILQNLQNDLTSAFKSTKIFVFKEKGPFEERRTKNSTHQLTTNTNKSFSWQIFFRNFVWQISDHDLTSFNFGFFLKKFAAWFSINRLATIQQRASRQVTSRQPFKKPIYKHYQENNITWLLDGPFLGLKIAFLTKQVTQPILTVPTYILTIPRNSKNASLFPYHKVSTLKSYSYDWALIF